MAEEYDTREIEVERRTYHRRQVDFLEDRITSIENRMNDMEKDHARLAESHKTVKMIAYTIAGTLMMAAFSSAQQAIYAIISKIGS